MIGIKEITWEQMEEIADMNSGTISGLAGGSGGFGGLTSLAQQQQNSFYSQHQANSLANTARVSHSGIAAAVGPSYIVNNGLIRVGDTVRCHSSDVEMKIVKIDPIYEVAPIFVEYEDAGQTYNKWLHYNELLKVDNPRIKTNKPSEGGKMKEMLSDLRGYIREHKGVIYMVLLVVLVDHLFFKGALRGRIQGLAEKLLHKAEAKLDKTQV